MMNFLLILFYIYCGIMGYVAGIILLKLIQVYQYGPYRFDCMICNWVKGEKYFEPLSKEEQEEHDFLTKEKQFNYENFK